jgi:hypothetical protein
LGLLSGELKTRKKRLRNLEGGSKIKNRAETDKLKGGIMYVKEAEMAQWIEPRKIGPKMQMKDEGGKTSKR